MNGIFSFLQLLISVALEGHDKLACYSLLSNERKINIFQSFDTFKKNHQMHAQIDPLSLSLSVVNKWYKFLLHKEICIAIIMQVTQFTR